jgi:hypothetical protein
MATINNSELFKELKDGIKLQQLRDVIPSQLADKVVPVMEVNPKLLRRANIVRQTTITNGTTATIYGTPTDKDFFLTTATLTFIKDVTATTTLISLRATVDGVVQHILTIPSLTLTVHSGEVAISLPSAVKIDKGTNIIIASATNVGNISISGNITGYTVDNINA